MAIGYTYRYPHPAVAADCVVFGIDAEGLARLLLIERRNEPHKGRWAFPGGFMNIDETAEQAAHRELHEETGLTGIALEQLRVYSAVERDPRERVLSVAFVGLTLCEAHQPVAADDAARAQWQPLHSLPPLAFDHADMLADAIAWLRQRAALVRLGLCSSPTDASALEQLLPQL